MTDFFLVHRDPEMVGVVTQAIAEEPDHNLAGQVSTGNDAIFYLSSNPIRVLLLQLALQDLDGFSLMDQLREKYPDLCIVPILEGNEGGDVWQRILQLDMRDVINGPTDVVSVKSILKNAAMKAAQLQEAFENAGDVRGKSYMIAVASARGGVGKSVFATNLALSMCKLGADVSLLDFSMNAGDFFTMLDHVPRNTIADAITQGDQLDFQLLKTLVADHPLGFKFLACPNQDFDFYACDYEVGTNILQTCRGLTEYLVVDTGVYDLPSTASAIDESDVIFLVTTRDLSRLLSLQRLIKSFKERDIVPQKLKVVVNNAEVGTEITEPEIESVLEHPVTAYLPSNPLQTTFSINSGKPLAQTKPDLPFIAVINKLGEYTYGHWLESD
ncbi:MAG: P-loop NTPase [Verrucomicrobiota bacterium]